MSQARNTARTTKMMLHTVIYFNYFNRKMDMLLDQFSCQYCTLTKFIQLVTAQTRCVEIVGLGGTSQSVGKFRQYIFVIHVLYTRSCRNDPSKGVMVSAIYMMNVGQESKKIVKREQRTYPGLVKEPCGKIRFKHKMQN